MLLAGAPCVFLREIGNSRTSLRLSTVFEAALQTVDGAWSVEIVKRGQARWYRIVHGDNETDWLSIAAVERILAEAGIDMADLADVRSEPRPADKGQHGAA